MRLAASSHASNRCSTVDGKRDWLRTKSTGSTGATGTTERGSSATPGRRIMPWRTSCSGPRSAASPAKLSRWDGTRLHLDNVIWKPPGASGLTMHQDGSYGHYMVPNAMTSLWMALTDTSADDGHRALRARLPQMGRDAQAGYLHRRRSSGAHAPGRPAGRRR